MAIPLTTAMVYNFATEIAGKQPGRSWSQRFGKRNQKVIQVISTISTLYARQQILRHPINISLTSEAKDRAI
jgi:hypothetical protein